MTHGGIFWVALWAHCKTYNLLAQKSPSLAPKYFMSFSTSVPYISSIDSQETSLAPVQVKDRIFQMLGQFLSHFRQISDTYGRPSDRVRKKMKNYAEIFGNITRKKVMLCGKDTRLCGSF